MKIKFSERLDELMTEKHISALALSKIININDATISRWRNGQMYPTIEKLVILCEYFGVTADYLLGLED